MIEVAGILAAKKEQRRQVLRARRALEPACRQVFDVAIRQRLQSVMEELSGLDGLGRVRRPAGPGGVRGACRAGLRFARPPDRR